MRPLQEAAGISASSMPSFQHFPQALRSSAQALVLWNPRLPAPELLHGAALAWALNRLGSASYLFGQVKSGGWWYFYLVALAVKLPLPLLVLFVTAIVVLAKYKEMSMLFPLAALAAVLLITLHVSYQVGMRHILVTVPLITIVGGLGIAAPLRHTRGLRLVGIAVVALLVWQAGESISAQSDFLAYFNELAGKDPSSVLVTGCDLDCGQDLFRLARELHARNTSQCTLLLWSSADIARSNLPVNEMENPVPESPKTLQGCVALSSRAYRLGDVFHHSYGPGYFSWLNRYQPVANVGRTIRLYEIPQQSGTKEGVPDFASVSSSRK